MKGLSVHLRESQRPAKREKKKRDNDKERKIKKLVGDKHAHPRYEQNDKLPGRDGADNFIFNVYKLRDDELGHEG